MVNLQGCGVLFDVLCGKAKQQLSDVGGLRESDLFGVLVRGYLHA